MNSNPDSPWRGPRNGAITPNQRAYDELSARYDVPAGHSVRDIQARNGYTPPDHDIPRQELRPTDA